MSRRAAVTLGAVILVSFAGAPSPAEARQDVRRLYCADAQQIVARQGAVVFTTGEFTFERFVSSAQYCGLYSRAAPKFVRTADTDRCRLAICRSTRTNDGRR